MSFSYSITETYEASPSERLLLEVIKQGPIPKHCAFILDGNRRFARQFLHGCLSTGYKTCFAIFLQAIHMCLDSGIGEMTAYMFGQANFKRSKTEVDIIMYVLLRLFQQLEKEIDILNELGISLEAIGKWERIPYPEITQVIARLMVKTKGNDKLKINMAMGYSGREEIVISVETIVQGLEDGIILPEDLHEDLVQNILTLKCTKPVDLLIRTSGVTRLSDFLLWTTNDHTYLEFVDVTWPEFKLDHFIKAICNYQQHVLLLNVKDTNTLTTLHNDRMITFVEQFKAKKWDEIEALCNN